MIIAVDGFSSCGKSTFARKIADNLGYIYIDTGAMYRAVALYALRHSLLDKEADLVAALPSINLKFGSIAQDGKRHIYLNGEDVEQAIRGMEVSNVVSRVAAIKEVRTYLVHLQRQMGDQGNVVLDGRDIGTHVFPYADIKIYMVASVEVRAERRYKELSTQGISVDLAEIAKNVADRDYADMHRAESPLCKADDAIELDNSTMTIEEQMLWFKQLLADKGISY